MIIKMKSFITKIKLFKAQTTNEYLLEEDEKILKLSFNSENNEKSDNKKIIIFDKKENYELIKVLKNALLILLFFKVNVEFTFHIQLLIRINN